MPFEVSEAIRTMSPEYQRTFTEGFEAGKKVALRELKEATNKIYESRAFSTSTATFTPLPTSKRMK